jgi:hypothetical protein
MTDEDVTLILLSFNVRLTNPEEWMRKGTG